MLQIIKRENVNGYEGVLDELSLSGDENVRISEAVDGEKVDGYGVYAIFPEYIAIYKISDGGDLMLADGILRSILFLAAMKGIERAEFYNGSEDFARRLGMIKDGTVLEPISDVFDGCQSCKHNI